MYLSFFLTVVSSRLLAKNLQLQVWTQVHLICMIGIRGNAHGENNWDIMRVTKGEYPFKPLHIVVVHLYANGAKLKKGII